MNLSERSANRAVYEHPSFWGWVLFLLSVLVIGVVFGGGPIVEFTGERIDVHVYEDHVRMVGVYEYENPYSFPVSQGFSIPLPVDGGLPEPVGVSAKLLPHGKAVPLYFMMGKHRFVLSFRAREKLTLSVEYHQFAPERHARYILTTTQAWKSPIRKGVYSLYPHDVKIVSSDYPIELIGLNRYGFEREDFMPLKDWSFAWEKE